MSAVFLMSAFVATCLLYEANRRDVDKLRAIRNAALGHSAGGHLESIYTSVSAEMRFHDPSATTDSVTDAMDEIARGHAPFHYDWFRLLAGTNPVPVSLNPAGGKWKSPESNQNEVAAYWPLNFPTNTSPRYVAIMFGGRLAIISNLPAWEAVSPPSGLLTPRAGKR